ncbi:MAG: rRNA pseudouridine synthase [Lachnospiraceae bacterium]|nr:rRNA pseudouridine synthase [Lachnospiraceae bacterium]
MRLDKYLADAGYGTRSNVKKLIKDGAVTVDGTKIFDAGFHISEGLEVCVNGTAVSYSRYIYYMLNKPAGYLTANDDPLKPTVLDLFPPELRHKIFAVGRLDLDTVGLLLLTNDGETAHRLLSPRRGIEKVYELETDIPMTDQDMTELSKGLTLRDGTAFKPAVLSIDADSPTHGTITITEGKYHEVKRLLKSQGKTVTYLKRLSMGPLTLDPTLSEGRYRPLTEEEIKSIL